MFSCNPFGEALVYINRQVVLASLRISDAKAYGDWNISKAMAKFNENKKDYNSIIAHNWLRKLEKGGSHLLRPLKMDHLIKDVGNMVSLLNRMKGNTLDVLWEDQMYSFIQAILHDEKYVDWAKVIAKRLHEELSQFVETTSFHMSSYLFYICAYCIDWDGLPHEPWT